MNKDPLISKEAREAYDKAYQLIREQKEGEIIANKNKKNPWLVSAVLLIVVTIIMIGTPVGLAISQLLGFNKFDSETLIENTFILPQDKSVVDEDITVSLAEFYADSNEIGLHLQAQLPKKHALLKEGLTSPLMSLSLTNEQGEAVIDSGIGHKWSSLDRKTGVLDFFYTLSSEEGQVEVTDNLDGAILTVYRIGAIYEGQRDDNLQPGYHELKGEYVEGDWTMKVDTSKLKIFDTLSFKPSQEELFGVYNLQVSPTNIMIETSDNEWYAEETSTYNEPELLAIKGDKEVKVDLESSKSITKEDGTEVYQLMFDFGGYDSYDKFLLTLPNKEVIEFKP